MKYSVNVFVGDLKCPRDEWDVGGMFYLGFVQPSTKASMVKNLNCTHRKIDERTFRMYALG